MYIYKYIYIYIICMHLYMQTNQSRNNRLDWFDWLNIS